MEHDDKVKEEEFNPKQITLHILINILKGVTCFHTQKVTRRVDKHPLFIM